ncbi:hypothetical protein SAMN02910456_01098 [Ruminococcaceae bacterium YRB3002]|nr:hypothetical protein SAMN02910456_01098 [Ruminococcaceae bacterium YRB3002]
MVTGPVDPSRKVIDNRWDSNDTKFMVKMFLPRFLMGFIPALLFYLMCRIKSVPVILTVVGTLMFLMFHLLVFTGCMIYLIYRSSTVRKTFNAYVDRFGRAELEAELMSENCRTFMIHPDKTETYVVITERFLIFSREHIFALDEIGDYRIDQAARGDTVRPYDPKIKKINEHMRFVRKITIALKNGKTVQCNIALENDQLREFDNALREATGPSGADFGNCGIVKFYYGYHGSIGGDSYHYDIRFENGVIKLSIEEMLHREYGELEGEISRETLTALEEICSRFDVRRWNGFNRSDPNVLDGDGFSLDIEYSDGKKISAHGSNSFPAHYREFKKALDEAVKNDRDRLFEAKRQEFIGAGVTGDPTFAMINFMQRGASGSDKYEILISTPEVRENNVDVRVKSVSGEIWPAGEHRWYAAVPDVAGFFGELGEIVRRLDIIRWKDYDRAAEDYNNEEWFQISISYVDGSISAMGTEHPEGYDEFRREVLKLVKDLCGGIEQ